MAVLTDSKRRVIVGAFRIFLGAKFTLSSDMVYKSDNIEMQTDHLCMFFKALANKSS